MVWQIHTRGRPEPVSDNFCADQRVRDLINQLMIARFRGSILSDYECRLCQFRNAICCGPFSRENASCHLARLPSSPHIAKVVPNVGRTLCSV